MNTTSNGLYLLLALGCAGFLILGVILIAVILIVRAGRRRRPTAAPPQAGANPAREPQPPAPPRAQPQQGPSPAPAAPRYCPQCGQPITPGARFCAGCGHALAEGQAMAHEPTVAHEPPPAQAAPPPYQPAPQQPGIAAPGEPILGVLTGLRRSAGLLKSEAYNLVVTPSRLIFAQVTNELMKTVVEEARGDAKAQGKGFFGQWGAQLGAHNALVQRYYDQGPEAIVRTYPGSFVVPAAQVQRVRARHGSMDSDGSSNPDRLVIQATSGKMTFQLGGGSNAGQAKKLLRQVLGNRVK